MLLPFLKEKTWPRIVPPMDEKRVNSSFEEKLEDHCMDELMNATSLKDVSRFRKAMEALVLNMFEEATDAPDAR